MAKSPSKKSPAKAIKSSIKAKASAAKPAATKPVAKSHPKPAPTKPIISKPAIRPISKMSIPGKKNGSPKPSVLVDTPPLPLSQLVAVPTDGKPRKNQIGLTSKELELFRDVILAKRREIMGDMSSMEREALRSSGGTNLSNLPIHMADMGTDNYEQEFTLGLMEKDRKLLRDLNDALAKIQNGTYGICEGTGKPISKARLEAQPWARFSIEYARKMEGRHR